MEVIDEEDIALEDFTEEPEEIIDVMPVEEVAYDDSIKELSAVIYSVYARPDAKGRIIMVFSDCFEQPQPGDILVKSGYGDEFIHTGYYQVYTDGLAHRYCVDGFGGIRECTPGEIEVELAEMQANTPRVVTDKERIEHLEEQVADQTEMLADLLYDICLMQMETEG